MKRIGAFVVILLVCCAGLFSQESNVQKTTDKVLIEGVEKYLNKISAFSQIFLNQIVNKISQPDNPYVRLSENVPVKLDLYGDFIDIYMEFTYIANAQIYISSKAFLLAEDEAEIVSMIAHELAHLASCHDRIIQDNTAEDYLKSELAADRVAILILKEMGYRPDASSDFFSRILAASSEDLKLSLPRELLVRRFLAVKKMTNEIYQASSKNQKYYKYRYVSESEFKSLKIIVKSLYEKYKSGK